MGTDSYIMKKLLTLLVLFTPLLAFGQARTVRVLNTIAELTNSVNNPSQPNTNVFVAGYYTPDDGGEGFFSWIAGVTNTVDNGIVFPSAYSGASGRFFRQTMGNVISVRQFGARGGTNDDTSAITAALNAVDNLRDTVIFPGNTQYCITTTIFPKSNCKIMGYGSTLQPHISATNTSGLILMSFTNRQNVVLEGLSFDSLAYSHWNNGNLWIRGSTNITTRNIKTRYGGYLANYVVGSYLGAPSVNSSIYDSYILDQRYGSSGASTANYSVAEGSQNCHAYNCFFDYPTVGNNGYVYNPPPPEPTDPKSPSLVISIDRGFNCNLYDCTIRNSSGVTNLTAIALEDNSGATNIFNNITRCNIADTERGFYFHYLGGRITVSDCIVENTTYHGLRMDATEAADTNNVQSLQVNNTRFLNCYTNAVLGTNGSGTYLNQAGQARIVTTPPHRAIFSNCEFVTWSENTNYVHLLIGSGAVTVKDSVFQNGSFDVRATDPAIPFNTLALNSLYGAYPTNRKVFIHRDNQYINIQNHLFGLYDAYAYDNWTSDNYRFLIEDFIQTNLTVSATNRLFSISTVPTSQSGIGTSGGFLAKLDILLSNNDPAVQSFGDVGSVGYGVAWTQSVTDGGTELYTNSPLTGIYATMPGMTGSRGYTNVLTLLNNPDYSTTDINLYVEPLGGVTNVVVYGRLTLIHTGWFYPPRIIK